MISFMVDDVSQDITAVPEQYSVVWLIFIGCFLVFLAVYLIALFRMTSVKKTFIDVDQMPDLFTLEEKLSYVKNKYSKSILLVQEKYNNKEISSQKAFQSLSMNLRNFSHEYSYTQANSMTLTELQENNMPDILSEKIAHFYPLAFKRENVSVNVDLAVADSLEVIKLWR